MSRFIIGRFWRVILSGSSENEWVKSEFAMIIPQLPANKKELAALQAPPALHLHRLCHTRFWTAAVKTGTYKLTVSDLTTSLERPIQHRPGSHCSL